jgi:hypothetical protein
MASTTAGFVMATNGLKGKSLQVHQDLDMSHTVNFQGPQRYLFNCLFLTSFWCNAFRRLARSEVIVDQRMRLARPKDNHSSSILFAIFDV